MKTAKNNLTHVTIAIGALVLAITTATPTFCQSASALTIKAAETRGNAIVITVANPTGQTGTGTVHSRVVTRRGEIVVSAPVIVAAGRTATVRIPIPERVREDFPLGVVVDDGVPF